MKPKIKRNLNSAKMHFNPNMEILPWLSGQLWRGQAQNGGKLELLS